MIKQRIKHLLNSNGYPGDDLTIEYSLNYCQGDGVAFYGRLRLDDVRALMERFFPTQVGAAEPQERVSNLLTKKERDAMLGYFDLFGDVDLEIGRNSHGHHYSHYNTMRVDDSTPMDFVLEEDEIESLVNEGFQCDEESPDRWRSIWEDFISRLQADVIDISKEAERDGYALGDAVRFEPTVVKRKASRQYVVRISEVPDEDFAFDCWDDELATDSLQAIIDGKERLLGLKAEVLLRDDELDDDELEVLGSKSLYGIVIDAKDKRYAGFLQDVLCEAIADARQELSRHIVSKAA